MYTDGGGNFDRSLRTDLSQCTNSVYTYITSLFSNIPCQMQSSGVVFMSGGITYDGHISKPGITELKVGSSENWYSRVR